MLLKASSSWTFGVRRNEKTGAEDTAHPSCEDMDGAAEVCTVAKSQVLRIIFREPVKVVLPLRGWRGGRLGNRVLAHGPAKASIHSWNPVEEGQGELPVGQLLAEAKGGVTHHVLWLFASEKAGHLLG